VIVRSYHSYSPGELSRKWKISHASAFVGSDRGNFRVGSRVRRVTFTGMLVGLLQYLGSVSISVQRFFIHALQPVIMAGVAAMIGLILSDPWYALILVPMFVYGSYLLWDHWRSNEDDDDGSREDAIMPLPDTKNTKPNTIPSLSPSAVSPPLHESVEESFSGGEVESIIDSPSSEGDHSDHSVGSNDDDDSQFNESSISSDFHHNSYNSSTRTAAAATAINSKKKRLSISSSEEIEVDVNDLFDLESLEVEED
jgi:hypothetical protein